MFGCRPIKLLQGDNVTLRFSRANTHTSTQHCDAQQALKPFYLPVRHDFFSPTANSVKTGQQ
jgi:hypothetical protein